MEFTQREFDLVCAHRDIARAALRVLLDDYVVRLGGELDASAMAVVGRAAMALLNTVPFERQSAENICGGG